MSECGTEALGAETRSRTGWVTSRSGLLGNWGWPEKGKDNLDRPNTQYTVVLHTRGLEVHTVNANPDPGGGAIKCRGKCRRVSRILSCIPSVIVPALALQIVQSATMTPQGKLAIANTPTRRDCEMRTPAMCALQPDCRRHVGCGADRSAVYCVHCVLGVACCFVSL